MMSSKVASIVIYSILVTVVSAQVWCYYGTSQQTGNQIIQQVTPVQCPGSYCLKNYQKNYNYNNYQTNSYGCANGICSRSGCSEDSHGLGSCCCRGNYCNSGFNLSKTAVSSMVVTIVSVVYMYL
ncbi:hypothetical protein L3Y34_018512 [Caenorhabditis briggsae]|uniref:Uncharacterized protein n=2 Tax=Caenorhabditis briggsae TaxID=6238 RepID=A0AAE9IVH0_CAEBR|nr:hypothetical protein L3Y34_018512 [Caenorhabditis briggsae]